MRGRPTVVLQEVRYGSKQYEQAYALREAVLRKPLGLMLGADDLRGEETQLHFGLFGQDGELIACVSAIALSPDEAKIRQTAVAPEHQRRGVGKRLMREVEAKLRARGFARLSMHARVSATGFYQKLGYQMVGDHFLEVTIPHVRMEKRLHQAS